MYQDERVVGLLNVAQHNKDAYFQLVQAGERNSPIARECKTACNTILAILEELGHISHDQASQLRCN